MERGYRDIGRSSLVDYDDYRSYSRQGRSVYADYESPSRESYLGTPGSSYRSGRSSYSGGSGSFDRDIMESLVQQRALQQQLSLRESQLALANTLLQQQQQQQFLTKRRFDPRGDPRQDFKRPRMMDMRSRPRSRLTGGRDSSTGGRGSRGGSSYRRNQRSGGHFSSDRFRSRDRYDPEKPTADEDNEGGKLRCKPCGVDCEDEEDLKKHTSSGEHKEQAMKTQNKKNEGDSVDRGNKQFCNICDVPLDVSFLHHQRLTFHKKRKVQVTKGCRWCSVTSFKNFTEVLEHRATAKHIKNQNLYEKQDIRKRGSRGKGRSRREREPVKVELPAELDKFDPKVVVGQSCVIAVTGWFCKLCNKFYNNENAAKETHCMTELHFNKYKEFMYTKLKAKAEAERDAREKAEEEERKKEEEEEEKKEGEEEEPSSEQPEGTVEEMADIKEEEHAGEETKQNGDEEEEAGAEGEEVIAEGEEAVLEEEEAVGEMMGEPEEYVDDVEGMAEEEGLFEEMQDVSEDHTGIEDLENIEGISEGISQEEELQVVEGSMEDEAEAVAEEEEDEVVEEVKEVTQKKTTRATVSSPGRGRGRGGVANRARRGRRVAK